MEYSIIKIQEMTRMLSTFLVLIPEGVAVHCQMIKGRVDRLLLGEVAELLPRLQFGRITHMHPSASDSTSNQDPDLTPRSAFLIILSSVLAVASLLLDFSVPTTTPAHAVVSLLSLGPTNFRKSRSSVNICSKDPILRLLLSL